jgi:hypothetical protein
MALRREAEDEPELRVVRGRGRPRKKYARHAGALAPGSLDWQRLAKLHEATVLRAGYRLDALPAVWYKPATDERLGDGLTVAWLAEYRALYPDDWQRMLRTFRKSGSSTTWTQATAHKKSQRDVRELASGNTILSDGDDPVYLQDLAHLMTLYPGMNRANKHKRRPIHRYPTFGDGAFIDPDEPAEIPIYVAFVPISERASDSCVPSSITKLFGGS